jgi:DnaJ-like protein
MFAKPKLQPQRLQRIAKSRKGHPRPGGHEEGAKPFSLFLCQVPGMVCGCSLQIGNCKSKIANRMSQFDSLKDYYEILGADERTSRHDLERLYKRMAARRHPDKGGTEEEMKSLNEAYQVLRNETTRQEYDAQRARPVNLDFAPVSSPPAEDIGLLGHCLSAFFCLLIGLFLLFLVRSQWIWFLWPLGILAIFVILFGIIMARSAMLAISASLPVSNRFRGHTRLQEGIFWTLVLASGYGIYLLLSAV